MVRVSIRMDEELRQEADKILDELGLNMTSAVNIFMKQLVRQGALPFTPSIETSRAVENKRRERLDSFLDFVAQNRNIENGYKFDRNECYDE